MRHSKVYTGIVLLFVAASFTIYATACRKGKLAGAEDTGYAADHTTSEQTFNDVQTISDQASNVTSGSMAYKTTGNGCATVTRTPGTITIDFGPTNCVCHDGRRRRGAIVVTYTGNYADSGSVHTITFSNFYQNDNKVTGAKTVTNMGHNAAGQPYFNVQINGSVTLAGGGTITTAWSRVRTWTKGYDTPADVTDDEYQVTGTGTMTRANGMEVSIKITTPLVVATSCHWIEAGTVTYSLPGGPTRVLNFGDTPNCDDLATVTLGNGAVKNITLP